MLLCVVDCGSQGRAGGGRCTQDHDDDDDDDAVRVGR